MRNVNSQKSLDNDQYPKILTEENNVRSSHRFDEIKTRNNNNNNGNRREQENSNKINKNNEDDDSPIISFVQMEGYFYCCGKQGHKSPNYNIKSKYQRRMVHS